VHAVPRLPTLVPHSIPELQTGVLNLQMDKLSAVGALKFSVDDLQLLHHFTLSTSRTFSTPSNSYEFWHTTVVQLAFKHDFLLHMIMAVSALHMLHADTTSTRLLVLSRRHQNIAIKSSRDAFSNVTQINCDALFTFSLLTYIHESATSLNESLSGSSRSACGKAKFLSWQWVRMARGVRAVLGESWQWIQNGPLSAMVSPNLPVERSPISRQAIKSVDKQLSLLEQTWCQRPSSCQSDRHRAPILSEALRQLRRTYSQTYSIWFVQEDGRQRRECVDGMKTASAIFTWLYKVSEEYIALLESDDTEALLVFAHYAVLIEIFPKSWWSNHRANRAITAIRSVLDERWHRWLEWPYKEAKRLETGWVK
jgi:hypothetical protein